MKAPGQNVWREHEEETALTRLVGEAPSKEAWREEPEPLLTLATGKRKRMALRKDNCLRSRSGTGQERNHLEGPRARTGRQGVGRAHPGHGMHRACLGH